MRTWFNALLGQQIKYSDRQTNSNTGYGFQYDMGGTVSMNYLIMKQMIEQNFDYYSRALTYDRFAAFLQMLITPMTDDIPSPEQYGMTAPTQWQIPVQPAGCLPGISVGNGI